MAPEEIEKLKKEVIGLAQEYQRTGCTDEQFKSLKEKGRKLFKAAPHLSGYFGDIYALRPKEGIHV